MLSIILRYFEDLEAVPDADREGEDNHDIGKHDDYLAKKHLTEIEKEKKRYLFIESQRGSFDLCQLAIILPTSWIPPGPTDHHRSIRRTVTGHPDHLLAQIFVQDK